MDEGAGLKVTESSGSMKSMLTNAKTFSPAADIVNFDDILKLETGMMGSAQILKYKAFVATPEPKAWALCAVGLLSFFAVRRRARMLP